MSESKSMEANKAGGMTRTNRVILIAAFILLAAAVSLAGPVTDGAESRQIA